MSYLIVPWWCHIAQEIFVDIHSGNDVTKELPEPVSTYG